MSFVALQYELFLVVSFITVYYELFLAALFVSVQYGLFLVVSFVAVPYSCFWQCYLLGNVSYIWQRTLLCAICTVSGGVRQGELCLAV